MKFPEDVAFVGVRFIQYRTLNVEEFNEYKSNINCEQLTNIWVNFYI